MGKRQRTRRNRRKARRTRRRRILKGGALVTGRVSHDTDSIPTVMEESTFKALKGVGPEDSDETGNGT
jgi:hypothetical protein